MRRESCCKRCCPAVRRTVEYYIIDGITVEVERKAIKNLHLSVRQQDLRVHLSVPMSCTEETIQKVVRERLSWLNKHLERFQRQKQMEAEGEGTGGEASTEKLAEADEETREQLRARLMVWIPQLIAKWEPIMGVKVYEWRIRDMKTRWGTCNVQKHRIWIAQMLAKKPLEEVEYVVVHELCHLLEPSHNARFWTLMTGFLPDWKKRRDRLNGRV